MQSPSSYFPTPSIASLGRDALLLPSHPFLLLPSPSALPCNLLPSLTRLNMARCGPSGLANVDAGWRGIGLHVCMHRLHESCVWGRYLSAASPAGAGFGAPSVSVSAAKVVSVEEEAAAAVSPALAFAPGLPGPCRFPHSSFPLGPAPHLEFRLPHQRDRSTTVPTSPSSPREVFP